MRDRKQKLVRVWGALLVVILVGTALFFLYQKYLGQTANNLTPSAHAAESGTISPLGKLPSVRTSSVSSIDGLVKLTMREMLAANQTKTYTFLVTVGSKEVQIFEKTLPSGESISLPTNAWSPDNKYFFIQENDPEALNYLVFKASGEAWSSGGQFYDIRDLFTQKVTGLLLTTATGWASPTLVILTTKKADGTAGPLYWFDLDSRSFLQLAR